MFAWMVLEMPSAASQHYAEACGRQAGANSTAEQHCRQAYATTAGKATQLRLKDSLDQTVPSLPSQNWAVTQACRQRGQLEPHGAPTKREYTKGLL